MFKDRCLPIVLCLQIVFFSIIYTHAFRLFWSLFTKVLLFTNKPVYSLSLQRMLQTSKSLSCLQQLYLFTLECRTQAFSFTFLLCAKHTPERFMRASSCGYISNLSVEVCAMPHLLEGKNLRLMKKRLQNWLKYCVRRTEVQV